MNLRCHDDHARRADVRRTEDLNGLDYLEVSADQRRLTVYLLDNAPLRLTPGNIRLTGGRRVPGEAIRVLDVDVCRDQDPDRSDCLVIRLDRPGDFSWYTLCLVEADADGQPSDRPLAGFDPRYRCLDFSFKAGCPSDLDCTAAEPCPPEVFEEPEINYLAKDYATFRQLILDRLALLVPDWTERHVPDLGIALVELLAYTGDYLSYYQDAVATEAYLDTARLRISVRRHARLVDYRMHEGCNARALVCLVLEDQDRFDLDLSGLGFLTGLDDRPDALLTEEDLREVLPGTYERFEPMDTGTRSLYRAHNRISFYTWGESGCCLPRGATSATLLDGWMTAPASPGVAGTANMDPGLDPANRSLQLQLGDLLLLEEVLGPHTGHPADADPTHRHAVRLVRLSRQVDPLYGQALLEVGWAEEDALPFALCLSATGPECREIEVGVARGNVVLVDHGQSVQDGLPPAPTVELTPSCDCRCGCDDPVPAPPRYRPALPRSPVVFAEPLPPQWPSGPPLSAARLLRQDPRQARPTMVLASRAANGTRPRTWQPLYDLLESGRDESAFVLEVDDERVGHLRFGDGGLGRAPEPDERFAASYRLGGGVAGNVGAEAIRHLVTATHLSGVRLRPRNPLAAVGGRDPEPVAEVKQFAPHAFRREQRRAVTADDYAAVVQKEFPQIQRATARLVWTGSHYAVQIAVDVRGAAEASAELLRQIERRLRHYRRIGHDLDVRPAVNVPLDLALRVCVQPHFLRAHVEAELRRRLGNGVLPDGRKAFFHPDNFSFGEGVFLSRIVAEAMHVSGVDSAVVTRLQRLLVGSSAPPDPLALETGVLPLGPFEIARLDNDPSIPENGLLRLDVRGGR